MLRLSKGQYCSTTNKTYHADSVLAGTARSITLSHKSTFGTEQEGMGLNWFIHTTPDGYQVLEHSGGTGGSRSSLQCLPQLNSDFIILTNSLANRNDLEKELFAIVTAQAKGDRKISGH